MKWPDGKPYYSLNQYYKDFFGQKTYKLALDIGLTCPNRDGTLDHRGCIFCSAGGSGDFSGEPLNNLTMQINTAKALVAHKYHGEHYIAYFQAFTNTYGPIDYLREQFMEAINNPTIYGLSIATRPDCLSDEVLELLKTLNAIKPVWVELGLQSIHEKTALFIRRCYPLSVFNDAVYKLHRIGIKVVVHLIIGLPGESGDDFLNSVKHICTLPIHGIKLQLLHVLNHTDLGALYQKTPFKLLTLEAYCHLLIEALCYIPPHIVIHRITGDAKKSDLLAPLWSGHKRLVLNTIHHALKASNKWQGYYLT